MLVFLCVSLQLEIVVGFRDLAKLGRVVESKFVCPTHSEAKQTEMSGFGAEKVLLQGQCKENRWLTLKRTKLPSRFQGSIFKGKVREGSHRVCEQLVHISLIG